LIAGHGGACEEGLHQRAVEVGVWHFCSFEMVMVGGERRKQRELD
jgi:hypothetical protein